MQQEGPLEKFFTDFFRKFAALDGSDVVEEVSSNKINLGKDERDAYVKDMVDRYKQGEDVETDDRSRELNITMQDILNEIAEREIKKILGGG